MIKTTVKIDGMMCAMCEAHICETIRKAVPDAKKVSASKGKKEAGFLTEAPVDSESELERINQHFSACERHCCFS